ncbi:TonB-dependent receptor [Chitinophagaceae bacterium LB-8]|uniref:TonB-dependent receptor n=1 Tax=Paraflavisolibacter caeni TaxID=2982496 RepID=A0A9X3BEV9_9BACT|nr:TonB-dependent receptor [Paraflavisolibacter caeni]MCU7547764.1 TonB-dependent receptor [Paraflavisolibacter caeni]
MSHCLKVIKAWAVVFFAVMLFSQHGFAQGRFTISGTITSGRTGEKLMAVSIRVAGTSIATASNEYGFYALSLPAGKHHIEFSAVGSKTFSLDINLQRNTVQDISMQSEEKQLQDVVVMARRGGRNISSPQMGVERLQIAEIKNIPVLFGERDVLKTIQLLPGIKPAAEGGSGFYVRGGAADQNLILLDEAPVYNASHLMGFFSTFNSDAIKDVTVYKGGMPAQYGGRLSSVLDIKMNEGNNQDYAVSGGIGLISSKVNVEGPVQQGKSSFLLSGRRTYADMFLKLSPDSSINRNKLYFYDLNAKINYKLSKRDHLYLSGYFGRDVLGVQNKFGIDWGNGTGTLRWNHIFSSKLFANTSLIFSNYNYNIKVRNEADDFTIFSQIRDWNIKQDYQWYLSNRSSFRFGFNSIYHAIRPGEVRASDASSIADFYLQKRYSWENAAFFSHSWKASEKLNFTYGVRLTSFSVLGAGDYYSVDEDGNVTDTTHYQRGAFVKTYINPEPRVAASYKLNDRSSIKASYVRNVQNLHLISNSTTSNPSDKWVASSNIIKPEISDQVSVGYYRDFADNKYEFTLEAYYKDMQNQIDYRNGADIYTNDAIESQLLFGKGRAYGAEWLLKKREGRFTGWLSYTLSKTERLIDGINNNQWYNARQDRTHDIAVVGSYQLNKKWTVSANWVFSTGNAVTYPAGKYILDGRPVFYYTERNGYRLPSYHRLDLGATRQLKQKGRFSSELSFSLYNAYGRENPFTVNFREKEDNPQKTEAVQYALFKYVPSIAYSFKF